MNSLFTSNSLSRNKTKTESEAKHFMDYKENKLYHFIQLELLRLKNLTKIFWRRAISKVLERNNVSREVRLKGID